MSSGAINYHYHGNDFIGPLPCGGPKSDSISFSNECDTFIGTVHISPYNRRYRCLLKTTCILLLLGVADIPVLQFSFSVSQLLGRTHDDHRADDLCVAEMKK